MTQPICITVQKGEFMTEHRGDPGLVRPGPAADDLTAEEELTGLARQLGRQHHSAAIAPFGDVEHVYRGEGSACLFGALGVTSPTTADNATGRQRLADVYCDALKGREAGDDGPGS
jgi:hypothetical protein